MKEHTVERPHLYPNLEDWPIYKLHAERDAFVRALERESLDELLRAQSDLVDLLQAVIYAEKSRVKKDPWKVDPPNELAWWRRTERKLVRAGLDGDAPAQREARRELLRRIVRRYAEEVVGSFKIPTFQFARKFLTQFFGRLLSAAEPKDLGIRGSVKAKLRRRLIVSGQVERTRRLLVDHHVVILPTHFSNLDSLLIGYALDGFAGIPHSTFGAGLNLLNSGWVAYFINRFGAYRVDRRKRNPVYLEVLKSFSRLAIARGVNSTFFPGGTRNRAGQIERELKLGLLGTCVEAQREMLQAGSDRKVVVVPLVLSYHFVLEAKFLIQEHLRRTGREQYLGKPSQQFGYRTLIKFLWQLFRTSSEIHLSLGQPLDVLGNPVDDEGVSLGPGGRPIDVADYFCRAGDVVRDDQRERVYTRMLGDAVVDRFHRDHVVLTSHVVAYVAFRILRQFHPDLDLYGVLRLNEEEFKIERDLMLRTIATVTQRLEQLEAQGRVRLSAVVRDAPDEVLRDGVHHMSLYHDGAPLRIEGDGLVSEDYHLLYYYYNRLTGYPLEAASTLEIEGDVRGIRTARVAMLPDGEEEQEEGVASME